MWKEVDSSSHYNLGFLLLLLLEKVQTLFFMFIIVQNIFLNKVENVIALIIIVMYE